MTKKWNLQKSAIWGALFGVFYLFARPFMMGDPMPPDLAGLVGYLVGGIVGGAFLFVVVAAIRNFFARANSN